MEREVLLPETEEKHLCLRTTRWWSSCKPPNLVTRTKNECHFLSLYLVNFCLTALIINFLSFPLVSLRVIEFLLAKGQIEEEAPDTDQSTNLIPFIKPFLYPKTWWPSDFETFGPNLPLWRFPHCHPWIILVSVISVQFFVLTQYFFLWLLLELNGNGNTTSSRHVLRRNTQTFLKFRINTCVKVSQMSGWCGLPTTNIWSRFLYLPETLEKRRV